MTENVKNTWQKNTSSPTQTLGQTMLSSLVSVPGRKKFIDLLPLLWEISSWFQLPPLLVCWQLTPHSSCSEPLHHHEEKLVCTFSTASCLIECLQRAGGGGVNPGIFARKVPASTELRLGSFDPPKAFQGHYICPKLWWNLKVWSMGNPPKVAAVQW